MKQKLRNILKAKRRNLSVAEITVKSAAVNSRLLELLKDKSCVMVYLSAFKEVCVDALIKALLSEGITVAAPVTNEADFSITPYELKDINAVSHGAYGIREPIADRVIEKDSIDAVIVPGIGFDKSGGRLGFGKGYYDRFLRDFKGIKIGVCYDFQIVDKIQTDENDIPIDIIVTESDCYVV